MNMHQPSSMYTYILHITNKDGFEWVDDNGETETIVAESFEKALDSLCQFESVAETIYNALGKDRKASFSYSDLLPLNITVTEIPLAGRELTPVFINETLIKKLDEIYEKICVEFDANQTEEQKKQKKIDQLKVTMKAEAAKLGLTLEDLKGKV